MNMNDSQDSPAKKKPPEFEDFLKPNPFIRPWMLPYLPGQPRVQDLVFVGLVSLFFLMVGLTFHWLGLGDIISATIGLIGVGGFGGEAEMRHMIAGAKFGQAKQSASRNKSLE